MAYYHQTYGLIRDFIAEIWSMYGQGYRNKADRKSNSRFVVSEKIIPDTGRKRGRIRPK